MHKRKKPRMMRGTPHEFNCLNYILNEIYNTKYKTAIKKLNQIQSFEYAPIESFPPLVIKKERKDSKM